MSKLEQLIQELCPNGVEFERLCNVCDIINGFAFKSNLFKAEGLPVVKTTNIQEGYIDEKDMVFFDKEDYPNKLDNYMIYPNDIVLGMSGSIKVGINNTSKIYYLNQRVCKFKPHNQLHNKYLYYVLSNSINKLVSSTTGGSVKNLSNEQIKEFQIPLPPIEIQTEIASILDNFTELTAVLTAELILREEQYEYYKEKIWKKNNSCKQQKLSKLCEIGDGLHGTPNYSEGTQQWFINGNNLETGKIIINKNTKEVSNDSYNKYWKNIKNGAILLSINGTIGKIAYYNEEKVILGKSIAYFNILDEEKIIKEYLYYYLQSKEATDYYEYRKTGSTIKNLGLKALRDMSIPLPNVDEQKKIVDILNRFDKLCNDISEGLPAEIEARQKQYEYYRDKLLTFKELKKEN